MDPIRGQRDVGAYYEIPEGESVPTIRAEWMRRKLEGKLRRAAISIASRGGERCVSFRCYTHPGAEGWYRPSVGWKATFLDVEWR